MISLQSKASRDRPFKGLSDTRPLTCAVVLFVKNESHDIAAWLAWYNILGFDTCIVYDDNSTDGTWEIIQAASKVQDVRFTRTTGPASEHHQVRQSMSYEIAIRQYAEEFDWLAFFDSDEYLCLYRDNSVKEFLSHFEEADQIAINWCIYGSNGHYLKPNDPPFEAYTRHSDKGQRINRHVKSFVRPSRVGPNWVCVHCFDVDANRNFLSNGRVVKWSENIGIIDSEPDWSIAKIMHYQCRSMEHFIERLKKLPEFQGRPHLWDWLNQNQIEDVTPLRHSKRVRRQISNIQRGSRTEYSRTDLIFDVGMGAGELTEFFLEMGFKVVGVEPGVKAFYELSERFYNQIASGDLLILNCAATNSAEKIRLFHENGERSRSFLAPEERQELMIGYHSYYVTTIDWKFLTLRCAVPILAKIDILGEEGSFLKGASASHLLPYFLIVFCERAETLELLFDLGYRFFSAFDEIPLKEIWSMVEDIREKLSFKTRNSALALTNEAQLSEVFFDFSDLNSFPDDKVMTLSGRWVVCRA